ncbi:hypothetical protein ACKFKF_14615 [Phormidesmis sp. 146-12]
MSITIKGTIDRKGFGTGTWAIDAEEGQTYELHKPPKDIQKAGLKVKVEGDIREDVMTIAMIGPVLEVKKFELIE